MPHKQIYTIFKQGSRTYFYSSLFFPKDVREDVFTLYSFVRTADDLVDQIPPQKSAFLAFKNRAKQALLGKHTGDLIIDSFAALFYKHTFQSQWIESFLQSMEADLTIKYYQNLDQIKQYIYGSAEVVGLMMAKILGLSPKANLSAQYLGRAMQYINFIRDIAEDQHLGRTYLPQEDIERFGLKSLDFMHIKKQPQEFTRFISFELSRYQHWQKKASSGFIYIPKRYLIPIKTASDMYNWTAWQIARNPISIYEHKSKPSVARIMMTIL